MSRAFGITGVAAGSVCLALAYGLAFTRLGVTAGPWLMVAGLAALSAGIIVLGAMREVKNRRVLWLTLAGVVVQLVVGFGFALAYPERDPQAPQLLLGLPVRTAVVLYGVGVLPLLVLPLVYALTFETQVTPPE